MRDAFPGDVQKLIPLIALGCAAYYSVSAAVQMQNPIALLSKDQVSEAKPVPESVAPKADVQESEPVHRSLVRLLNDLDDILDTIQDADSFEAAKPKLLSRAREQAALAARRRNSGMTAVSPSAQGELQPAITRHAKSLARAVRVVPAVNKFFNDEIGAILSGK